MLGTEATVVAANTESPRAPRLRVRLLFLHGAARDIAESGEAGQFGFMAILSRG